MSNLKLDIIISTENKKNCSYNQANTSVMNELIEKPFSRIKLDNSNCNLHELRLDYLNEKEFDLFSFRNFEMRRENALPNLIQQTSTGGRILLVKNIIDGKNYLIKELNKKLREKFLNKEVKIYPLLNHENILKMFTQSESKNYYFSILENADKGSLFDLIRSKYKTGMVEKEAHFYFIQIVSILKYLHHKYFIHRNLRLEDILLNESNRVKLCDFSTCLEIPKCKRTEFYLNCHNSFKANFNFEIDIASLGTILYILLHGNYPRCNPMEEIKFELSSASKDLLKSNFIFIFRITKC